MRREANGTSLRLLKRFHKELSKIITAILTHHALDRLRERLNIRNCTDEDIITQLNANIKEVQLSEKYLDVPGYNISFPFVLEPEGYICKTIIGFCLYHKKCPSRKINRQEVAWKLGDAPQLQ